MCLVGGYYMRFAFANERGKNANFWREFPIPNKLVVVTKPILKLAWASIVPTKFIISFFFLFVNNLKCNYYQPNAA